MSAMGEHGYGDRVHLCNDAWTRTALARISSPTTSHPELMTLVRAVYQRLLTEVLAAEIPTTDTRVKTRMAAIHPKEGHWQGSVLDPAARVVVVDLVRAGMVPAQVCFEALSLVLPLENLRLDHVTLARREGKDGHVAGVDLAGSKVGGTLEGATVLLPDPMGATGSTLVRVLHHLIEGFGRPRRIVAMPMIATPEFLKAALAASPELVIYAGRVDRGLSKPEILDSPLGARWDEERGLDSRDYIVPGAGGLGEVLNNSWC